jgi:hypothetical protein
MLAATAGCIMKQIIMPAWQADSQSLIRGSASKNKAAEFDKLSVELPAYLRAAEEFFLLPYLGFTQKHARTGPRHRLQYRDALRCRDDRRFVLSF